MNEQFYRGLIVEYEKKRNRALAQAEQLKKETYEKFPELQSLDEQIQQIGLSFSKALIRSENNSSIKSWEGKLNELKNKKQELLKNAGLAPNAFEPVFECKACNDTGFVAGGMCSCYKQELINIAYKQANLDLIENDNFQVFDEKLYSDNKDIEKYETSVSPRENILKIKNRCLNFVERFDQADTKNLLFIGDPGLGKTFLSNCIAKELLENGKNVIYQTSARLLDMVMDYKMRFDRGDNFKEAEYNKLFEVKLLIIDDLGTEPQNPARLAELFTIINTRLLTQKTKLTRTMLSTNLSLEELNRFYDDRLMSRILGEFDICKFFGEDIRIKKRAG